MKASLPPNTGDVRAIAGGYYVCKMIVDTIDEVWSWRGTNDKLTGGQMNGQTWWAIWIPQDEVAI